MLKGLWRRLKYYPHNGYYDAGYSCVRNMLRTNVVHPAIILTSIESHEEHPKVHMRIFGHGMRSAWDKLGGYQALHAAQVQTDSQVPPPPL